MRAQWKPKSSLLRYCETCKQPLKRRRNEAGRLEGYRDFMRRRFCSLSCANSRSKGGGSRKASHYHARKLRVQNCEACGFNRRLQAHHVNENWRDNSPVNIQTLCIHCHSFWHGLHRRHGVAAMKRMPRLDFLSVETASAASPASAVTAMLSARPPRKGSSKAISKAAQSGSN